VPIKEKKKPFKAATKNGFDSVSLFRRDLSPCLWTEGYGR